VKDENIAKMAKELGGPVTFGSGFGASLGVAGSVEIGTAYHPDGRFACYETYCGGGDVSLSFQAYTGWGFYLPGTWDQLAGESITFNTGMEVELPFTDIAL